MPELVGAECARILFQNLALYHLLLTYSQRNSDPENKKQTITLKNACNFAFKDTIYQIHVYGQILGGAKCTVANPHTNFVAAFGPTPTALPSTLHKTAFISYYSLISYHTIIFCWQSSTFLAAFCTHVPNGFLPACASHF